MGQGGKDAEGAVWWRRLEASLLLPRSHDAHYVSFASDES
jgi:hypothetical protein